MARHETGGGSGRSAEERLAAGLLERDASRVNRLWASPEDRWPRAGWGPLNILIMLGVPVWIVGLIGLAVLVGSMAAVIWWVGTLVP